MPLLSAVAFSVRPVTDRPVVSKDSIPHFLQHCPWGDTFRFVALINAKEYIMLKHVNEDGTIEWGMSGVAGENDNLQDHWGEGLVTI